MQIRLRWIVPVLLGWTCVPPSAPKTCEFRGFDQAGRSDVGLNETLVFHFSRDLDKASVTRESVQILAADGTPVVGSFAVAGSELEFRAQLPRRPDLSDGGFVLGGAYSVLLHGFPRPDGLRARRGEPLSRSHRMTFGTADRDSPGGLFVNLFPGTKSPILSLEAREIGPLEPIVLTCSQALNPETLDPADFDLFTYKPRASGSAPAPLIEHLSMRVRLVENRPELARIELRPVSGERLFQSFQALIPGQSYFFLIDGKKLGLETLRRQTPLWRGALNPRLRNDVEIRVVVPRTERIEERFLDTTRRSPQPFPGVDGTACWAHGGELGVRFPLAAGSGAQGAVRLGTREGRVDVHATRLELAANQVCELRPGPGLVVLRAQGKLEIAGTLRRRCEDSSLGWRPGERYEEWRRRTAGERIWSAPSLEDFFLPSVRPGTSAPEQEEALSAFLERARERDLPWTILIAGGDLVVTGRIEVDAPVLLVAGGWVRIAGRVEAREVWKLRDGGGASDPALRVPPLRIDEPAHDNPLRTRLRLAILSNPLRPPESPARWKAGSFLAQDGNGSARVSFLGVRETEGLATQSYGPVDDLALLEGCEFVRFVVQLEVGPGPSWDPPSVQMVAVSWYKAATSR